MASFDIRRFPNFNVGERDLEIALQIPYDYFSEFALFVGSVGTANKTAYFANHMLRLPINIVLFVY